MTDAEGCPEPRGDDPSIAVIATPTQDHDAAQPKSSVPSLIPTELRANYNDDSASHAPSTAGPSALPSTRTSPGAHTPTPTLTVSALQLASEALSTIPASHPHADSVPSAAADLLIAIHRKHKKAPAVQSPRPGSIRSRSAATTPVPSPRLLNAKHGTFDATANSSRATTPNRTPSGRAKRQRRERHLGTPTPSTLALPSIEQNDRRRSARVAQTATVSTSDSPSMPNLALFGFSPYLENLVMNAKETDRRTRSGGRGIRPPVERAPARVKRATAKTKSKDTDPDGPDDEVKLELYRELCIISYQLQAHLDMVPHKPLHQLRAQFSTPSPEADDGMAEAKLAQAGHASATHGPSTDPSRAATPALYDQKYEPHSLPAYSHPTLVKAEPPHSPRLSLHEPQQSRPPYSPESSPEVALMDTVRPPPNGVHHHHPAYPHFSGNGYQPEPAPCAAKIEYLEDDPMSPVFRPARSNIMSISALMSGPSPAKQPSPSPEPIQTPPRPVESLPKLMQEWTYEDEMASQFLQACFDAAPKIDTTELDRLTQIAQLAAFDLEMLSASSSPRSTTPSLLSPNTEQKRDEAAAKSDPRRLNPLDTLDTQALYDREEAEYHEETQANDELYSTVQYLSSFDQVVDEWRAGELARLRLQLEMRKAEVDRIWTCDRKLAWSTFIDDRAGELYRKGMAKASRKRWQAEMELDLLEVHRRKTRGLAKLTKGLLVPKIEGMDTAEVAELYERHGRFVSAAKYPTLDEPLVRGDIRKMRIALRAHQRQERQAQKEAVQLEQSTREAQEQTNRDTVDGIEVVVADADVPTDAISSSESEEDSDDDYDSDSSYASSGISSLPSFSSAYSSPRVPSIAEAALEVSDLDALVSEVASVRDDDSDEDADESLWARQIRLANQLAEQGMAPSATASGIQTPAVAAGEASTMPSRAASPALSAKAQARKQQRDRKRKKRPPPPGARLWKKGRVQQDADAEPADEPPPQQVEQDRDPYPEQDRDRYPEHDRSYHPNGHQAPQKEESRLPSPQPHQAAMHYDYRRDDFPPPQAYERAYGMRPSYLPAPGADEYDYARFDPYASARYANYAPTYPSYARDGYAGGSPPPERVYVPSYAQYEQGGYPSHPPPPPAPQQQQQIRPSWPY
ncbi:hypothetical protein PSEUBRA_006329 [Kalmanozyma brasiliensis GHG001]|nr:uncharacterized protein PSEUBRA_006329 [Kalmanozyma brasiliensis GHG001]EST04581.2 hypothetical protein PSEUBRA_006329 [Kalmanozyma brasiliensis GHG001]